MINFKRLMTGALCLSVGALSLVSCLKDSPVPFQVVVDVYIQDMKTDSGVKYGVFGYSTANYDLKSVTVTAPGTGGKVYQLAATFDKKHFVYYPPSAEYTSELPVKGDYAIEIVALNGDIYTGKDAVGDEKLAPIVIKTSTINSHKLKTTWDKITGADAYLVKLYSADKSELLFSSNYLGPDNVQYEFGASDLGWASGKSPVTNTNYVLELLGLKAETGVVNDKGSNLQFITVDSKTIQWE